MTSPPRNGNPLTFSESLATEEKQGGIDDLPGRLAKYATAHERALEMAHYVQHQSAAQGSKDSVKALKQLAYKLHNCGTYLLFRHYTRQDQLRLVGAQFCKKHLLCPLCAIRRGTKAMQAYEKKIQFVMGENPGVTASMVTVTLKNGDDLGERYLHLKKSLKRWMMARRSKGYESWEIRKMLGAVWSFEIKRGTNSDKWHPHAHMIWLHQEGLSHAALVDEWKWATGDSFILDVRPIRPDENGSLIGGMLEVFKYACKFSEMTLSDNFQAFDRLSGERMISSAGLLWGVEIPEELTDEELSGPYVEMLYRLLGDKYRQDHSWQPMAA